MTGCTVDLEKLRRSLQSLSRGDLLVIAQRAVELVPNARLPALPGEGSSWNVGVHWRTVFPAYFRCLAETATAEEFARTVDQAIMDFAGHDRSHYMSEAWRAATAAQQTSLSALAAAPR
jgi:hypothetical protein